MYSWYVLQVLFQEIHSRAAEQVQNCILCAMLQINRGKQARTVTDLQEVEWQV